MLHKSKTRKLGETVSPCLDGGGGRAPKEALSRSRIPLRRVPSPRYNQSSKARVPCPCSEPSLVARSQKTSAKTASAVRMSQGKTKLSEFSPFHPSRFPLC